MTLTLRPIEYWDETQRGYSFYCYDPVVCAQRTWLKPAYVEGCKCSDCKHHQAANTPPTPCSDYEFVLVKRQADANTDVHPHKWLVVAGCHAFSITQYRKHVENTRSTDTADKARATNEILDAFEVWIKDHTA